MLQTIHSFQPTAAQDTYLQQKLGEVSRSFALVVPLLEAPLRQYLATAYLLCRVVDNIEDCLGTAEWKRERFTEFTELLNEPQNARRVLAHWEQLAWEGLTPDEARMMGTSQGLALWEIFAQLPSETQRSIRRWAAEMAQGMNQINAPAESPFIVERRGIRVLSAKADYDEYCYYVAGTVGQMVTELVDEHYMLSARTAHALQARAEACGRGLQKTNIVKDFREDLERGMCYLPASWLSEIDEAPLELRGAPTEWTARVLGDVLDELRDATRYLVDIPSAAGGYRHAALMCLLPAYQTIRRAAGNAAALFTPKHESKISRLTMAQCLADAQVMLYDNDAINAYSQRIEGEIRSKLNANLNAYGR